MLRATAKSVVAGCSIALLVALASAPIGTPAAAGAKGSPNPGVLPPQSDAYGATYDEWGDAWFEWGFSQPATGNPLTDATGADAASGQSGHVWFLCGVFGASGTAERTVTVPAGKALFFPIVNSFWINTPEFGDNPWSPAQEEFAREQIADLLASAGGDMTCTIDGKEIAELTAYHAQSPGTVVVNLPADNFFGALPGDHDCVVDGYYLMVAPLTAGRHTIHFTAGEGASVQDVTYHITVKQ